LIQINVPTAVIRGTDFKHVKKWKVCPGETAERGHPVESVSPKTVGPFRGGSQVLWDLKLKLVQLL